MNRPMTISHGARGPLGAAACFVALWLALGAGPAAAQASAPITAEKHEDLALGATVAGNPVTVTHLDPGAAKFRITGPRNRDVLVTFVVPVVLLSGATPLAVTFGDGSAAWASADQTAGRTTFNPATGVVIRMPSTGNAFIWVGGSVSPLTVQPGGTYTGSLQLNVVAL